MEIQNQNIFDNQNFFICLINKNSLKLFEQLNSKAHQTVTIIRCKEDVLNLIGNSSEFILPPKSNNKNKLFTENNETILKLKEEANLLSKREKEVLSFLAQGKKIKQIAELLFISVYTVQFHIKNIYRKFDIHSQLEAVNLAGKIGLIQ